MGSGWVMGSCLKPGLAFESSWILAFSCGLIKCFELGWGLRDCAARFTAKKDPRLRGDISVLSPVSRGDCQEKAVRSHRLNFVHKARTIFCLSWRFLRHIP